MDGTMAFLGFGEAGRAICEGLGKAAAACAVHDLKLQNAATRAEMAAACTARGATPGDLGAVARAGLIFCLVTADQAVAAARAAAPLLAPGALWLDGNSCAPSSKAEAARVIEAAGGRYVDVAIMAAIHPRRHRTPMLIAGPHAHAAQAALDALGMEVQVAGPRVGDASTIKMLRSVIVKGLEALTAEAFLAARRAGVAGPVFASLQGSDPGIAWEARTAYNLERMMVHGARRAAEMEEVARTLRDLGLPDGMAAATVDWQRRIAALALEPGDDAFAPRADAVLAAMG
jgi:3-hydroxyisobutyrate dehydrogenase-like beta-hydroxyacid dehydrogenase